MLNIKHTICPSCSVGCGINIVSSGGKVLGTYPYKRHPINEGKNCLNGRGSVEQFEKRIISPSLVKNDELVESDNETVINLIKDKLSSINSDELCIICSGKNTIEEFEVIKKFAESFGTDKIGFYGYNFPNFDGELASYDDISNAKTILAIGDVLRENPLIGRRVIISKENGGTLISVDTVEKSNTALNSSEHIKVDSIGEFINDMGEIKDKLDGETVILINKIEDKDYFNPLKELAAKTGAKFLPIYKEANIKGAMRYLTSLDAEEIKKFIADSKALITVNTNLLDFLSKEDIKGKSFIINISNFEDDFTRLSDLVLPGKPWTEKSGSFINSEGLKQEFISSVISDDENLSEIEIFDKLT
ncbi:formate dehydrogenase major subunit [Methanobrevibacter olleyae]|uniref:Formate dehydrogenase major subunit n=1 Tax=Methanobrevibacter olleyae TaxID=294671 RepID=A0A1I4KIM8_METOL|nr:molybdopterin-dependent oxidoreductase [Methanobrevibacter olleyae]SFL78628.1 formate dehydrogenase major subunit [Methanobrevibacter olleyae]